MNQQTVAQPCRGQRARRPTGPGGSGTGQCLLREGPIREPAGQQQAQAAKAAVPKPKGPQAKQAQRFRHRPAPARLQAIVGDPRAPQSGQHARRHLVQPPGATIKADTPAGSRGHPPSVTLEASTPTGIRRPTDTQQDTDCREHAPQGACPCEYTSCAGCGLGQPCDAQETTQWATGAHSQVSVSCRCPWSPLPVAPPQGEVDTVAFLQEYSARGLVEGMPPPWPRTPVRRKHTQGHAGWIARLAAVPRMSTHPPEGCVAHT